MLGEKHLFSILIVVVCLIRQFLPMMGLRLEIWHQNFLIKSW